MRIFQVMGRSASMLVSWNRTWIRNLHEPLLDLGHDVVLLDAAEGWQAMQRRDARACARFSDRVVDAFRREHRRRPFDLFFAYLMDGMIEPSAIDQIRRMGVLTCNFSCNNVHQFDLVDGLAPHFDVNLHAERVARAKFVAIGANALWWQMGSNPLHFHPRPLARTIPVSFVGANYALRARYVARLLEAGIDVHAFGPSWQYGSSTRMRSFGKRWVLAVRAIAALDLRRRAMASAELADHDQRRALAQRFPGNLHAPVSDEALVDLYARSHVSLGFLEVYEGHAASAPVLKHLHLREFEAPMCGALLVTGRCDELEEFFVPEREVVTYGDAEELVDKVRYYLAHSEEAEQVRSAGHARALRDHTCHRRFESLFRSLGLA